MRPRLHALVTEQLRTVQQQIAEFQVLERQLAQVIERLQTTVTASHADGCQCLGSDTPEAQEPHLLSIPQKGATMPTATFEPLTILPPSPLSEPHTASTEQCGCGCGCGVSLVQFALPRDALPRRGDAASAPPTQP
jgi:hypothetical protein